MRLGPISKMLAPGYGHCLRCATAWRFVEHHVTEYTRTHGMFPLCEPCWSELDPPSRLPYYEQLLRQWADSGYPVEPDDWGNVRDAVLEGR